LAASSELSISASAGDSQAEAELPERSLKPSTATDRRGGLEAEAGSPAPASASAVASPPAASWRARQSRERTYARTRVSRMMAARLATWRRRRRVAPGKGRAGAGAAGGEGAAAEERAAEEDRAAEEEAPAKVVAGVGAGPGRAAGEVAVDGGD